MMIQRKFVPGSNWLYIKLYTGEKVADEILIKAIFPIVTLLHKQKKIEKWFFLRFADPDFHLRIRFLLNEVNNLAEILFLINTKLKYWISTNQIWRIQLDTYTRELERYKANLIEETESIFFIDSECVLSILKKINRNEHYRWMISLKLIDELLSNFYYKTEDKQQLMDNISKSFKIEFELNDLHSKQFNIVYRKYRSKIENVLNDSIDENEFKLLFTPIKKRTKKIAPIIDIVVHKVNDRTEINNLLKSYIHIMIDRIFTSKNRSHEMILSDFLSRYYLSEIAKNKYNKKNI